MQSKRTTPALTALATVPTATAAIATKRPSFVAAAPFTAPTIAAPTIIAAAPPSSIATSTAVYPTIFAPITFGPTTVSAKHYRAGTGEWHWDASRRLCFPKNTLRGDKRRKLDSGTVLDEHL